ncbi:MAG TPA: cation:proton antiporter subunit C [Methanothermobacter thermautotrophicus]|jgi:energy-converting hydrogenase B subunit E|uniref:Cation:proton antiporter subunit C n=2 Tax=Methanothermobacter TaxID=145260 RepID=A0A7J4MWZ6_METTF|nr:cation:proton antiporter subunit C [Methanothermobacter sp.]HIH65177.1 cation:proton antiporter subunit C [Methanothermobacter thermautotrophicus]HIH71313.1 cation:proton antiporter subunit C [Methanothermobacter thermautotrophicus]
MMISLQLASLLTAGSLMVIGAVAVIFIDNLIKKVIALSFIADGVNLFLVTLGYKPGGIVYIYLPGMSGSWFAQNAAYPLPFALVLTSIVIGASTLAVMLGIIIILYHKHGTISASKVLEE